MRKLTTFNPVLPVIARNNHVMNLRRRLKRYSNQQLIEVADKLGIDVLLSTVFVRKDLIEQVAQKAKESFDSKFEAAYPGFTVDGCRSLETFKLLIEKYGTDRQKGLING